MDVKTALQHPAGQLFLKIYQFVPKISLETQILLCAKDAGKNLIFQIRPISY
jgi:hypothetical protein